MFIYIHSPLLISKLSKLSVLCNKSCGYFLHFDYKMLTDLSNALIVLSIVSWNSLQVTKQKRPDDNKGEDSLKPLVSGKGRHLISQDNGSTFYVSVLTNVNIHVNVEGAEDILSFLKVSLAIFDWASFELKITQTSPMRGNAIRKRRSA